MSVVPCRSSEMSNSYEEILFDLTHSKYVPIFRRVLPAVDSFFKNAKCEIVDETKLRLSSCDWNDFNSCKELLENLIKATVDADLSVDYEDVVNILLGNVKMPKKYMLGKLRDVFIDCNNVAMSLVSLLSLTPLTFVRVFSTFVFIMLF